MNWDQLLDRMRRAGFNPAEEDFMDNYGPVAAAQMESLRGRYFRCTFGAARAAGVRFEAYTFSSEGEAEDFLHLAQAATGGWKRRRNMVFHVSEGDREAFGRVLDTLLED